MEITKEDIIFNKGYDGGYATATENRKDIIRDKYVLIKNELHLKKLCYALLRTGYKWPTDIEITPETESKNIQRINFYDGKIIKQCKALCYDCDNTSYCKSQHVRKVNITVTYDGVTTK